MLILTLRPDLQPRAVELEYEMFRNAKVANLYKASVLKKVGSGRVCLWARVGETAPLPSQAVCLPPARQPHTQGSLTSRLCQLKMFLANPLRTRTCPVSSDLQPQAPESHLWKAWVGAFRS